MFSELYDWIVFPASGPAPVAGVTVVNSRKYTTHSTVSAPITLPVDTNVATPEPSPSKVADVILLCMLSFHGHECISHIDTVSIDMGHYKVRLYFNLTSRIDCSSPQPEAQGGRMIDRTIAKH